MKDRARAIDELQRLDALGVTWVNTDLLGRTAAERLDGVETLRRLVADAGVR